MKTLKVNKSWNYYSICFAGILISIHQTTKTATQESSAMESEKKYIKWSNKKNIDTDEALTTMH
jgi:hypothetical protein